MRTGILAGAIVAARPPGVILPPSIGQAPGRTAPDVHAPYAWRAAGYQRHNWGQQPSGDHVDPGWVKNNGLLLSYSVKRKRIQPQARNVHYFVQGDHYVFSAVDSYI